MTVIPEVQTPAAQMLVEEAVPSRDRRSRQGGGDSPSRQGDEQDLPSDGVDHPQSLPATGAVLRARPNSRIVRLAREFVDHRQTLQGARIGAGVEHEVVRPYVIDCGRRRPRRLVATAVTDGTKRGRPFTYGTGTLTRGNGTSAVAKLPYAESSEHHADDNRERCQANFLPHARLSLRRAQRRRSVTTQFAPVSLR